MHPTSVGMTFGYPDRTGVRHSKFRGARVVQGFGTGQANVLTNTTRSAGLFQLFDRLNDPDDLSATDALANVLRIWTANSASYQQERLPVLLENRIEILSHRSRDSLTNPETRQRP
jgi:hypothetical protein